MRKTIDSVQYLRGLAAIAVLISHSLEHPLNTESPGFVITGRLGVMLFFVISGFIMVIVTGAEKFDAKSFLTKRMVRVVPFYWAVTFFTAILAIVAPQVFKTTTVSGIHLVASLLFIPMYNPSLPVMISPLVKLGWTLNFEIFFYFVFSCTATVNLGKRVVALTSIFAVLIFTGLVVHFELAIFRFYTHLMLMGFVGGVILGYAFLKIDFRRIPTSVAITAAIACILLLVVVYTYQREDLDNYSLNRTVILVAFCMLLLSIGLWIEAHGKLLKLRFLYFVGDASYSIYLMHMFGVGIVVVLGKKLGIPLEGFGYIMIAFTAFLIGLLLGCITHIFVEKPLIEYVRNTVKAYA